MRCDLNLDFREAMRCDAMRKAADERFVAMRYVIPRAMNLACHVSSNFWEVRGFAAAGGADPAEQIAQFWQDSAFGLIRQQPLHGAAAP